ncbi:MULTISPECIES: DUF397 domain-containing protein [unclassified Streptomyces]|uniref:DUF397 domain-containing protein n=1 Tax=unclassified Streptomyces TaxID=2593676 RepID=UPI00336A79D6
MSTTSWSLPCDSALRDAQWRRSSYSTGMNNCVETASLPPGLLAVRDSKNTAGPALLFAPEVWITFVDALCDSAFDTGAATRPRES